MVLREENFSRARLSATGQQERRRCDQRAKGEKACSVRMRLCAYLCGRVSMRARGWWRTVIGF